MAIWLWLAKMDRPLSENEYHDMLELLPEDRRLRLERIPREKHQEVLCAYPPSTKTQRSEILSVVKCEVTDSSPSNVPQTFQ